MGDCTEYVAAVQEAYQLGWAAAMNLLQTGLNVVIPGVTLSSGCGARRAVSLQFSGFIPQTVIDDPSNSVTTSALNTGASAAALEAGVQTVKNQDTSGSYSSVAVPSVSSTTTPIVTAVTSAPTIASSSDDDTGLLVGVIIGSVVGLAVLVAIAVLLFKRLSTAETVSGTSMEMGDAQPHKTFVDTQTNPGVPAAQPTQL